MWHGPIIHLASALEGAMFRHHLSASHLVDPFENHKYVFFVPSNKCA